MKFFLIWYKSVSIAKSASHRFYLAAFGISRAQFVRAMWNVLEKICMAGQEESAVKEIRLGCFAHILDLETSYTTMSSWCDKGLFFKAICVFTLQYQNTSYCASVNRSQKGDNANTLAQVCLSWRCCFLGVQMAMDEASCQLNTNKLLISNPQMSTVSCLSAWKPYYFTLLFCFYYVRNAVLVQIRLALQLSEAWAAFGSAHFS